MRWVICAAAVSAFSCAGLAASGGDDALQTIADAPEPYTPPSLTATIPVDPPAFALGDAAFDLSAHPEKHEIRVSLMLGAPVSEKRWSRCRDLDLDVDGERIQLPVVHYSHWTLARGVYDAVSAELSIEQVRTMSAAREVRASVCGDVVYTRTERLTSLREFVRRFEEMATHDGPSPPQPPAEFDPEQPDGWDEPVTDEPLPA